jgi:hypothetical protein
MDRGPAIKRITEPHGVCRDEDLKDWLTILLARKHLQDGIEQRP